MEIHREHDLARDLINSVRTEPGKMIIVGCCEDPLANEYASLGWEVWGYDFRPYQDVRGNAEEPKFKFTQGDFCQASVPPDFFDVAVDVSAIHHFGLGWYGDPNGNNLGDVVAVKKIIESLKPGGSFVCVTDVGHWVSNGGSSQNGSQGHWRLYDKKSLQDRIIQGLEVIKEEYWDSDMLVQIDETTAYSYAYIPAGHIGLICRKP